jgi:hypothetical protein
MLIIGCASARLVLLLLFAQTTDSPADNFKELGSLFLWGIGGAVGLAVVVVLIWLRIQARRGESSGYVSISPSRQSNRE